MGWRTVVSGSKELTGVLQDLLSRTSQVERFHDLPTGAVIDYAGLVVPPGFLWCDGRAVSRLDYSGLFVSIGTSWGAGDGSTTFNVPNLVDRVTAGAGSPLVAGTLGAVGSVGGEKAHLLLSTESGAPAHDHGGNTFDDTPDHAHLSSTTDYGLGFQVNAGSFYGLLTVSSNVSGGATARHHHPIPAQAAANAALAHNNMQPYAVMPKIIRF